MIMTKPIPPKNYWWSDEIMTKIEKLDDGVVAPESGYQFDLEIFDNLEQIYTYLKQFRNLCDLQLCYSHGRIFVREKIYKSNERFEEEMKNYTKKLNEYEDWYKNFKKNAITEAMAKEKQHYEQKMEKWKKELEELYEKDSDS